MPSSVATGHQTMHESGLERGEDSGIESSNADSGDNSIYIRINVPELKIQKCLQFHPEDTVWMAKQRILDMLSKELRDSLNYGLYCPPMNGRAGKFLDEERPLKDYPLPGPIGFLEFKYKRRVYKLMQLNPRRLKQLHTRSTLKQFLDHIRKYDMEKLNKMTIRGLDPNFHEHETGETPLTVSTKLDKPRNMILALVGGGAHIDFRTRRAGLTPLHRAAQHGNYEAIKTFLDLGASPNYKDSHSLTPLYHCISHNTSPRCAELLLHDHALVGVTDEHGWSEVHQACKYGRVQHLEHLLFYGADMNNHNSSGNTPLHVCAVNNQEECARVLLFRGVDKNVLNYANQDAFQVAVISGNVELSNVIRDYRQEDVVPFQELPTYNEKRRMTVTAATLHKLQRSRSDPRLNLIGQSAPTSPAMSSNRSMPHFLANGTLFEPNATGSMMYENVRSRDGYATSEASMSVSSGGSYTGSSYVSDHGPMSRSVSCDLLNSSYTNTTPHNTSRYSVPDWSPPITPQTPVPAPNGRLYVCTQTHVPQYHTEISLQPGDFVQVLTTSGSGYWEGSVGAVTGWFPAHCVAEVVLRKPESHHQEEGIILNKPVIGAASNTAYGENVPRTVQIHKGKNGYGFVLRGAKSQNQTTSTLDFRPTADFPALQYLDRVDKDSMADRAGLRAGDFLLEINGESVMNATHERTVSLIKGSGDILTMKVMTVAPLEANEHDQRDIHADGTRTLPYKKKDRLDKTLAQYDNDGDRQSLGNTSDSYLNNMATARGIDPNNKTASISRRTKRLSSMPLDGIFERQGSRDMDTEQSASNQTKPVVKVYADPHQLGNGADGHHVTRVHLQDGDPHSKGLYSEIGSSNVTNVRLSTNVSRDHVYSSDEPSDGIYAVPYKHQQDGGLSVKITDKNAHAIPPHPRQAPPTPPRDDGIPPPPAHEPPSPHSRDMSQVVPIHTNQHQYANVSENIQQRQRSGTGTDSDSSFESSFRPGTNARMTQDPVEDHSRHSSGTSSMSSEYRASNSPGQSSKSSLSVSADVHQSPQTRDKFYEPEPDYDKQRATPPESKKLPTSEIQSLRSAREAWSSRESSNHTTASQESTNHTTSSGAARVSAARPAVAVSTVTKSSVSTERTTTKQSTVVTSRTSTDTKAATSRTSTDTKATTPNKSHAPPPPPPSQPPKTPTSKKKKVPTATLR